MKRGDSTWAYLKSIRTKVSTVLTNWNWSLNTLEIHYIWRTNAVCLPEHFPRLPFPTQNNLYKQHRPCMLKQQMSARHVKEWEKILFELFIVVLCSVKVRTSFSQQNSSCSERKTGWKQDYVKLSSGLRYVILYTSGKLHGLLRTFYQTV